MKKIITMIIIFAATNVFSLDLRMNSKHKEWVQNDSSFGIFATIFTDNQRPNQIEPLQVVYMIDVSQNFTGNVRQEYINGGIELLKRLSDNDYFGIILYSEFSRTLLPLSQVGFIGRDRINSMLSELSTERGRNPLSALERAISEFTQNQGRRSDSKSLVMSVLGQTDEEDGEGNSYAKRMISAMTNLDVQVYTVGYGDHFDEDAAIEIAEKTGGRAYFAPRDRADLLKGRFELMIPRIINPTHSKNVQVEFLTRDAITVTNFLDSTLQKIFVSRLTVNDTVTLFWELKNRPRRSSDIDVDFDYENTAMRSSLSGTTSLRVNPARGNSSSYTDDAHKYIRYQVLFNMAKSIDELKIGDRAFRRAYADGYRRMLETRLGPIRNEINTRQIQQVFVDMVAIYEMINGGTATNEYIAKFVKYSLHYCSYPE